MNYANLISLFSRYIHRIHDVDVSQMCGLAEGTGSATLKTTAQIVYSVYNQHGLIKAATDNIAMTACAQQAISTFCYYLVSIDVAGAITVTKGTNNVSALPATPQGRIPIGVFLVTTDGSATFTSGATDLSAAGITVSYSDIDMGIAGQLINQAQKNLERGVTIARNGRQVTVSDFDHMKVRSSVSLTAGDTVVTLPFSNYKDFADHGVVVTDSSGLATLVDKEDNIPVGYSIQGRPTKISRTPSQSW